MYLAGLVDGEGSISIISSKRGWCVRVTIYSAAEDEFLRTLYQECGCPGHFRTVSRSLGCRPLHVWEMSRHGATWFLKSIEPHLRLKKLHAGIALDMCTLLEGNRKGKSLVPTPHEQATRKLLQLALEYAHLSSGSRWVSRWATPGSRAALRTQRLCTEITQVLRWKLLPESQRQLRRYFWSRCNITPPFYEAAA
jgi:hypothetical protein